MWFQETAITITAAAIAMEKEVTSLFHSDCCSTTSSSTSSPSAVAHQAYSAWVWMTIIVIGLYTVTSIYTNAMACYQFLAAWSLISRTNQFDVDLLHNYKRTFAERRDRIHRALHTQLYSEQILSSPSPSSIGNPHQEQCRRTHQAQTDESTDSCPICLMEFQSFDRVSSCKDTHRCQHVFHEECLNSWLDKHQSCPCCRFDILPSSTTSLSSPNPTTITARSGFFNF